jgi:hypothetical protein
MIKPPKVVTLLASNQVSRGSSDCLQEGERSGDVVFDDLQHRLAVWVVAIQEP